MTTGSGALLSASLCGYGLAFLTSTMQARALGPVGRGLIATAAAPAAIFTLGLCLNIQDYFAREAASGADTRRLSRAALLLAGLLGVPAAGLIVAVGTAWQPVGGTVWWLLVAYAALMPTFIYGTCVTWLAAGSGRFRVVALARILPGIISLIGLSWAWAAHAGALAIGLMLIFIGVGCTLVPLVFAQFRPSAGSWWQPGMPALRFGLRAWPASTLVLVSQRIDLLIVAFIARADDVAYYAIATNLAAVLTAVSNSIAVPARNAAARREVAIMPRRTAKAVAMTSVAFVVVGLAVPLYVQYLLGPSFEPLQVPAWILLAAEIPLAGAVVLTQILGGWGLPGRPLLGGAAALCVTGGAAAFLYPIAGLTGVALGCFAGNVLNLMIQLHFVRRDINPSPWISYLVPRRSRSSQEAGQ